MHIFFSGIGGTGIGPLAIIAKQAGYDVSGSDKRDSDYISYLRSKGIADISIGQSTEQITGAHSQNPIDWFVYSSALPKENYQHPELIFCQQNNIRTSKRDELLNQIIKDKDLNMVAVAGTHGKSTTTAMIIWLFKQLGIPISYSVGAKISFGEMGHYEASSEFLVYECDEFDRNFLAFYPYLAVITGVSWDHHEIFPTQQDYNQAFKQFIDQSGSVVLWQEDWAHLELASEEKLAVLPNNELGIANIKLLGKFNRLDGWIAAQSVHRITNHPIDKLIEAIDSFPGLSRRFEKIVTNLYTDYAHTPEKIAAALNTASEQAKLNSQAVVAVYEPLTNRRMYHTKEQHVGLFGDVSQLYWVPSYLAREDQNQLVLSPSELVAGLSPQEQQKAKAMELNNELKEAISSHLLNNDLVICLSGGGGGSLDEWLRKEFVKI